MSSLKVITNKDEHTLRNELLTEYLECYRKGGSNTVFVTCECTVERIAELICVLDGVTYTDEFKRVVIGKVLEEHDIMVCDSREGIIAIINKGITNSNCSIYIDMPGIVMSEYNEHFNTCIDLYPVEPYSYNIDIVCSRPKMCI